MVTRFIVLQSIIISSLSCVERGAGGIKMQKTRVKNI